MQFVAERTEDRGEYCLLHEEDAYSPHQVEHIVSRKHGGQDPECRGTQSSQLLDDRTVEILRSCQAGGWFRVIRRMATGGELVLEISGRRPDGRQVQMRLVLEKQ